MGLGQRIQRAEAAERRQVGDIFPAGSTLPLLRGAGEGGLQREQGLEEFSSLLAWLGLG